MSDPTSAVFPPVFAIPEPARAAVQRFLDLRAALVQAEQDVGTAERRIEAAKAREHADQADAIRRGDDPAKIADQAAALQDDLQAAIKRRATTVKALSDEWYTGGAQRAITSIAADEQQRWRTERDERVAAVQQAASALVDAQARWLRAASMQAFYSRIINTGSISYGGLGVRDGDLMPFEGFSDTTVMASIRHATDYLDRHSPGPEEPEPEPEAAEHGKTPARLR